MTNEQIFQVPNEESFIVNEDEFFIIDTNGKPKLLKSWPKHNKCVIVKAGTKVHRIPENNLDFQIKEFGIIITYDSYMITPSSYGNRSTIYCQNPNKITEFTQINFDKSKFDGGLIWKYEPQTMMERESGYFLICDTHLVYINPSKNEFDVIIGDKHNFSGKTAKIQ